MNSSGDEQALATPHPKGPPAKLFDGALGRRILALAGPTVAAMISQTLINQADHILVGRLPAAESVPGQAALQISLILLWAVGGSLSAISVGTQALTARRLGENDPIEAGRVLTSSLAIAVSLGLVLSLAAWAATPHLFRIVNRDPSVVRLGVPFLRWRYLQVLPMVVAISYKSFFDGIGKTWVHMVAAIAMNVVNFVLNIAFIFGKWGFPRMGVEGSGLASCLSSYLGMLMMAAFSMRGDLRARFRYYRLGAFRSLWAREIGRLSLPSAGAALIAMGGFGAFMVIVGKLDRPGHPIYSAATANIINIFQLVFISCIAYGTATATLVGQSMGARLFDLAERYANQAARIGFLLFCFVGLFVLAKPDFILHVWCKDQAVIDAARDVLRVLGVVAPLASVALVFTYALYGAGNSRFVMLVELVLHLSCLVPLAYLLGIKLSFGMWGVWSAMIVYVVLMTVIMTWKFRAGGWKEIRI